jgi:predicted GNAT family acetyltransferase
MAIEVTFTDDPDRVLTEAGKFLAADPVGNNLILTLLHGRISHVESSRNWIAKRDGAAVGVVFEWAGRSALVTRMARDVVVALADAIARAGGSLPGVSGEAATAAAFAGQWTEVTNSGAVPVQGDRVYEATTVEAPSGVNGRLRQAGPDDLDFLVTWMRDFLADVGDRHGNPEQRVERGLTDGLLWLWEDGGPVSMAAHSLPVGGVVRIGPVYTPPEHRKRGYASACTAALTSQLLASGHRCILHTDLGNPSSNSVYQRIGYRAVEEMIRYRF